MNHFNVEASRLHSWCGKRIKSVKWLCIHCKAKDSASQSDDCTPGSNEAAPNRRKRRQSEASAEKRKKKNVLLNTEVCSQQNHGNFVKVKSFRIWSFFSQRSAPSLLHRASSGQTDLCWESLQFQVFLRSFYGGPEVPQLEYFRWGSRRSAPELNAKTLKKKKN